MPLRLDKEKCENSKELTKQKADTDFSVKQGWVGTRFRI